MLSRRFRVLLHPFFFLPEAWNGMDEHLLLLAKYLDSRFELVVLAHESDGPQTHLLAERAGIRVIDAPYRPDASAGDRLSALRSVYSDERVDLVHLHSPVAGGQAIPALAARLAGVPATVATYHQIQARRLSAKSRAINRLTHTALVDRTVAVSHGVRHSLVSATGLPEARIQVIHNGIDDPKDLVASTTPRPPVDGEVRIGYFGRLSPEKGLPDLLEGLALLAPRCPSARTLIVGDGPERAALEAMASRLGIADRVLFLGFRADARRIMAQVDVVVHVPVYEGFGLVVLEAMAAGRPVVTNDAPGGVAEIVVHGETGLVVPASCPESLAQALAYLAEDPHERERLGESGRIRRAQHFSARGMVERITMAYEDAFPGLRRAGAPGRRSWPGRFPLIPTPSQPRRQRLQRLGRRLRRPGP